MKYLYLIVFVTLFACSGSEDNVDVEPPTAINDTASTSENTAVTISVLTNDTLTNNATLFSFDSNSVQNGTVIEVSNRLIYTPADSFTGTDTFTYTICDGFSTPNCATATVTITVSDSGDPIAVDDAYDVIENSTTNFTTLLTNDTLADGATLDSIDTTLTIGTAILNDDNSVSYTALNGYSGEDTFTYTLCDNDANPTCVTATVTITIEDEGNPNAVDDSITVLKNETAQLTTVLSNDSVVDDAAIISIDTTLTMGSVTLNTDGTLSYIPANDFEGQDTFTYTICDDDSPENSCSTATVTLNVLTPIYFNIPAELHDYYDGVLFIEDGDLMFEELESNTTINHTTILEYTQRHDYLYDADKDSSNPDNVILMYSGESRYWQEYQGNPSYTPLTFNTEHVYPQSLFEGGEGGADKDEIVKTDLHHLRACDATINSDRSNHPFTDGSGTYQLIGDAWYPGDEWKGDVARMILYLNNKYGESFNKVGSLELFLKWNVEDPVSEFEEQRNEVIYGAQGNRNAFIDNPYLATIIWGGEAAENRWN
ncbi:MAG: Ig-like domain-containing protein [Algibacter sp.]|uniref:Ig-like domain-containing protein n=1 Tax=Algibacter sp. TaxID=1872428 RepID=UPI003299AB57